MWRTSDLAEYLGLTREAVQQSSRHYEEFLSETGAPPKGDVRQFTPQDVARLEFLHDATARGATRKQAAERLRAAIDAGQFDEVDGYPDTTPPEGTIPYDEYLRDIAQSEAAARQAVMQAETAVRRAEARAEKLEKEANALREALAAHQATIAELRRQLKDAAGREEKIGQLQREIGRLEAELNIIRRQAEDD